jgi:hypothetical protein
MLSGGILLRDLRLGQQRTDRSSVSELARQPIR